MRRRERSSIYATRFGPVHQNTDHPLHNPYLEILSTIPPYPNFALQRGLGIDLALRQATLRRLLTAMREEGQVQMYDVHVGERYVGDPNGEGRTCLGLGVCIVPSAWKMIDAVCDNYMEMLYANEDDGQEAEDPKGGKEARQGAPSPEAA
jgi:hypothetical protein